MIASLALAASFALTSPSLTREEGLTLAKVCLAEVGWEVGSDCRAILRVLQNRPYPTITEAAKRYNARATGFRAPLTVRQKWISNLTRDGREPKGWPASGPPWRLFRTKWLARVRQADALLREAARVGSPCRDEKGKPCEPQHWGGPMDRAPRHYERITCGTTRNTFYRVRSLRRG